MRPRASHIFLALDYAIGAFFALSVLVIGAGLYALGGAPKRYELQELGGVYTRVLLKLEGSARHLRSNYCADADAETAAAADCDDLNTAL